MTASTDMPDFAGQARRADQEDVESAQERRNRNWTDILQELRVAQTGVQLLTAFLLALPFQNRFASLTTGQEWLYLAVVLLSILATGLLIMPVSLHRALFRKQEKETLVQVANRLAQVGLAILALAISGVVLLIFDVTKGRTTAAVAASATLVALAVLWAAIPALITRSALTED
ncbi:DUF6328 family protein [Frankia sp. QA3]|uniref:DUF6328 family protein n=1 Tax=Frankia sp. QA3 TaxID=710111 RepID=UPI00055BB33E